MRAKVHPISSSLKRLTQDFRGSRPSGFNVASQVSCPEVSERLLRSPQAVEYLTLGFKVDHRAFDEAIRSFGELTKPASRGANSRPPTVSDAHDALLSAVKEELELQGNPPVRVGVTGGMDSRLLLAAVLEVYPEDKVTTYTFGYPSQYDYEFMRVYSDRFLTDHLTLDTRDLEWSTTKWVRERRKSGTYRTYSAKGALFRELEKLGLSPFNVHGFLGGPLSGGQRRPPETDGTKEGAYSEFMKVSDRFSLLGLFEGYDLNTFMPKLPKSDDAAFDYYDMLYFGLRQYQRIGKEATGASTMITPFGNARWAEMMLSLESQMDREQLYFRLAREKFPVFFPELVEHDISDRKSQKVFKEQLMLESIDRVKEEKNPDGSRCVPQVTNLSGRPLVGRQFCEYAEYHNNPSYRAFVDDAMRGLRERSLFSYEFLDDVKDRFFSAQRIAAEQTKGLVNLELNIRAKNIRISRFPRR